MRDEGLHFEKKKVEMSWNAPARAFQTWIWIYRKTSGAIQEEICPSLSDVRVIWQLPVRKLSEPGFVQKLSVK